MRSAPSAYTPRLWAHALQCAYSDEREQWRRADASIHGLFSIVPPSSAFPPCRVVARRSADAAVRVQFRRHRPLHANRRRINWLPLAAASPQARPPPVASLRARAASVAPRQSHPSRCSSSPPQPPSREGPLAGLAAATRLALFIKTRPVFAIAGIRNQETSPCRADIHFAPLQTPWHLQQSSESRFSRCIVPSSYAAGDQLCLTSA